MRLSVAQLQMLFHYDPDTGVLLRHPHKKPVNLRAKGGARPTVEVGGYRYSALRLVWALVTGEWPKHTAYAVRTHNQDSFDLRWSNLYVVPDGKKECGRCRQVLPTIAFYVTKVDKSRAVKRRIAGYCRACNKAVAVEHRLRDATYAHRLKLQKYNMTPEDYTAMLKEQFGGCAICKRHPQEKRRLAVDHCHTTGRVRGLLCAPCNVSLGAFDDDPRRLLEAAKYLLKNQAPKNYTAPKTNV